jgi:hypothetical protein
MSHGGGASEKRQKSVTYYLNGPLKQNTWIWLLLLRLRVRQTNNLTFKIFESIILTWIWCNFMFLKRFEPTTFRSISPLILLYTYLTLKLIYSHFFSMIHYLIVEKYNTEWQTFTVWAMDCDLHIQKIKER